MKKEFIITTGNIDSQGDKIMPNSVKMPEGKTIPVLKDFDTSKKPLGVVKEIKIQDDKVVCVAELNEDCTGLYPAIGFQIIESHEENGVRVFDFIKLHYVGLTENPNVDKNIKPIA